MRSSSVVRERGRDVQARRAPGRPQGSQYTGGERDRDDDPFRGRPPPRGRRERRRLRQDRADGERGAVRERESQRGADGGEHHAFDQQDPRDLPPRRAQRAQDREVVAAVLERLRERDEQHETRRRHQQQREAAHERPRPRRTRSGGARSRRPATRRPTPCRG